MLISFRNTVDNSSFSVDGIEVTGDGAIYRHLRISLPSDLADGEYVYTLETGETGLCQIGDYVAPKTEYKGNKSENNINKVVQYNG